MLAFRIQLPLFLAISIRLPIPFDVHDLFVMVRSLGCYLAFELLNPKPTFTSVL
jgi:hypothetical protein